MNDEEVKLLWMAVVIQAIEDYIAISPVVTNKQEQKAVKLQAEAWFSNAGADYQEVCSNAGIDSRILRKIVMQGNKYKILKLLAIYRNKREE